MRCRSREIPKAPGYLRMGLREALEGSYGRAHAEFKRDQKGPRGGNRGIRRETKKTGDNNRGIGAGGREYLKN